MRQLGTDYGTRVRWYVEGETEEGAARHVVGDEEGSPVEIINLRGSITEGRKVAFRKGLEADKRHGRFSMVSVDADNQDVVAAVRGAIRSDLVVGAVYFHDPDFEFGNFSREELVDILWEAGDPARSDPGLRDALSRTTEGVGSGRELLRAAGQFQQLARVRKGHAWGERLMRYAMQNQKRADGTVRPIVDAVYTAIRSPHYNYHTTRTRTRVDPISGRVVPVEPET